MGAAWPANNPIRGLIMFMTAFTRRMLDQEARALLTRLNRVKPFVLYETMVPAANVSFIAQTAIERYLAEGRRTLRFMVHSFRSWLGGPAGIGSSPADAQRRLSLLRLRFNTVLAQFDIFADAYSQRSEHETGVWLAGLDVAAADALELPGYYRSTPVMCYLDRGIGAAIRRARTRLPGGGSNPVAIIRIPRERMVGSGIASSLVHEVGHQASALLDLVDSLRPVLKGMRNNADPQVWQLYERWLSEILADFWSVARLGVTSTLGLMGVLSLPRAFVFRVNLDDPHPFPWIRVKLSCAIGDALYPHPQWDRLSSLWSSFYPTEGLDAGRRDLLARLQTTLSYFVALLINHRPSSLHGASLIEALEVKLRQPSNLAMHYHAWRRTPTLIKRVSPTLVFAVIGQARFDGSMSPEQESELTANLLRDWALRSALNISKTCASLPLQDALALAT